MALHRFLDIYIICAVASGLGRGLKKSRRWSFVIFQLLSILSLPGRVESFASDALHHSEQGLGAVATGCPQYSKVGERRVYAVEYSNTGYLDIGNLLGSQDTARSGSRRATAARSMHSSLRASLVMTVIHADTAELRFLCQLLDTKVMIVTDSVVDASQSKKIETDLLNDFVLNVDRCGRVRSFLVKPTLDVIALGLLRALLSAMQIVHDSESTSLTEIWEVEEQDIYGSYLARYEVLPDSRLHSNRSGHDKRRLRKRKLHYIPTIQSAGSGETLRMTYLPEAVFDLEWSLGAGGLVSCAGQEKLRILLEKRELGWALNECNVRLLESHVLTSDQFAAVLEGKVQEMKSLDTVSITQKRSQEEVEESIHVGELGDLTFQNLISLLNMAEMAQRNDQPFDRGTLYLKFKALIYLHPQVCDGIAQLLLTAGTRSVAMDILVLALGMVGHAEAQDALMTVLKIRAADKATMMAILPAIGDIKRPTEAMQEFITEIAYGAADEDVKTTAALALGMMANHLAVLHPARSMQIVQPLLLELHRAKSTDEIVRLLSVVANTASTTAIPLIERYASDSSSSIRASAMSSLILMDQPVADQLLRTHLNTDPEFVVRMAAASVLIRRRMTSENFAALRSAFDTEQSERLRLLLLAGIWGAREEYPQATSVVRQAAEFDTQEKIKNEAIRLIEEME